MGDKVSVEYYDHEGSLRSKEFKRRHRLQEPYTAVVAKRKKGFEGLEIDVTELPTGEKVTLLRSGRVSFGGDGKVSIGGQVLSDGDVEAAVYIGRPNERKVQVHYIRTRE